MKVLHVGKFYPPHMGGMETHLADLCSELRHAVNLKVVVAGDPDRKIEIADGIHVTRLQVAATFASTPFCRGMIDEIRTSNADVVHVHWPNPAAVLAFLASGNRGSLVVTYHSDILRHRLLGSLFEPILHRFLSRSEAILVTSQLYLDSSPVLRKHRDRCHVVPLGIRVSEFASCDPQLIAKIRRQHGERILLAVGRHVYYKGFRYLIEAMSSIDAKLLIIGGGPLQDELKELAVRNGVGDKITFLGNVPDAIPYYHACDLFILPSIARTEAFGLVQLEAMAAGKPVINTMLDSGVPSVSLHQVTGLTVPPKDSNALAGAVNRLLSDHDLRSRFGEAARARAYACFDAKSMASRTLDIYASAAKGATTPTSLAEVG